MASTPDEANASSNANSTTTGEEFIESIVIDNGSGLIKAGFSGEDTPRSVFPTVFGSTTTSTAEDEDRSTASDLKPYASKKRQHLKESYVGHEAQAHREVCSLSNPIERGHVTNWDTLQKIWEYTLESELSLNSSEVNMPILMTDVSPLSCKESRDKMGEIMFETFQVPQFYVMGQSVLSLFASGRTRGIVLELGHGASYAVPVFEGYALQHATLKLNVGGIDLNRFLVRKMIKTHQAFSNTSIMSSHAVQSLKEACVVVINKTNDDDDVDDMPFELPDGTVISIPRDVRTGVAEALFQPSLVPAETSNNNAKSDTNAEGIHEMVNRSISMCDEELQRDLYSAVVCAGGTSMIPGLATRLDAELTALNPARDVRVIPSEETGCRERGYNTHRKNAAWIGGSMFASLPTFKKLLVSKQEWDEARDVVLHRKCF